MYLQLCYSCLHGNKLSQIAQLAEQLTVNQWVAGSSPALGAMNRINMDHLIGKKVELISTTDEYTKLQPGAIGVVSFIDDTGTVFVNWDNGSRLGLIPGVDKWKFLL